MDFNKVILVGRLTRDTENQFTTNATEYSKFGIALNNGYGEKKKVVFVDVTAWGKTANFVKEHFTKGKEILIEGRLEFDQWEKDGQKHSKLYVTAEKVSFAGSKPADYSVKPASAEPVIIDEDF